MPAIHPHYQYVLELYRERNITRAARKVGIQQSGLSKILKQVEEELGQSLFQRVSGGLVPTAFAHRFARELTQVRDGWDEKLRGLKDELDRVEGTYRLGCHPVVAANHLSTPFARFHRDHPGARIELALHPSIEVVDRVLRSELDFGLVANPHRHPELVIKRVAREHAGLWVSGPSGKLEPGAPVYYNPDMISIHSIIRGREFAQQPLIAVKDYPLIVAFAEAQSGQGAILPSGIADRSAKLKSASQPYYHSEICVIHRSDLPKTRGTRAVLEAFGQSRSQKTGTAPDSN